MVETKIDLDLYSKEWECPYLVVKNLHDVDIEEIKEGDVVYDTYSKRVYRYDDNKKPYQVSGNHEEFEFIKNNPDQISHIFEDKLKMIEYLGNDKNEYIQKLMKLKDQLDQIIIKWV